MAVIGIDIGGTSAKLALVVAGDIRTREQVPTGRSTRFEEFIRSLGDSVLRLRSHSADHSVTGIGVAAPGFRVQDGTGVVNVTNLPNLDGQPLREALSAATGLAVEVENDANAAALGEYRFGGGRRTNRLLVVTVGTGIGAGMIVDGEVLRTAWGGLGDPGHITVFRDGPRCACGARGCLEALAPTPATLRRAAEMGSEAKDYPLLVSIARSTPGPERDALLESGVWLGVGLSSWTHLLAPDCILLGGGAIDAAGDIIFNAMERSYRSHVQPFLGKRVTLGRARLGNDAGLLGAASLVPE